MLFGQQLLDAIYHHRLMAKSIGHEPRPYWVTWQQLESLEVASFRVDTAYPTAQYGEALKEFLLDRKPRHVGMVTGVPIWLYGRNDDGSDRRKCPTCGRWD